MGCVNKQSLLLVQLSLLLLGSCILSRSPRTHETSPGGMLTVTDHIQTPYMSVLPRLQSQVPQNAIADRSTGIIWSFSVLLHRMNQRPSRDNQFSHSQTATLRPSLLAPKENAGNTYFKTKEAMKNNAQCVF